MTPRKIWFLPNSATDSYGAEKWMADEGASLLGGEPREIRARPNREWKQLILLVWAVAATTSAVIVAVGRLSQLRLNQSSLALGHDDTHTVVSGKRNLIFMVSDGMGPASLSMTRSFRQFTEDQPIDDILALDKHLIGTSRTRSNSSLVTDSAAGATAFSCAKKSYNGAVSVLPDYSPCGTVLEAAKKAGYMTGLVVTTDITDATPACFSSHVKLRKQRNAIAHQQIGQNPIGRVVDLMFGGGRCQFLPKSAHGSCRKDNTDVIKLAQEKFGWKYISTRQEFDSLEPQNISNLPLMGLFADSDIPYELDRRQMNSTYPSLDEMARTALEILDAATRDSEKGFFLMIEGSRIDHAGHANEPSAQVREVLAYDQAFSSVIKFLEASETQGVLVATSDHETGGLTIGRQLTKNYPKYKWFPEALANASHSAEYLAKELQEYNEKGVKNHKALREFISQELVQQGLGIFDASEAEINRLIHKPSQSRDTFADMVSRRAQIGWTSHGHTGTDVNIYGTAGSERLRGNHENTEVGNFLQQYLEVDVEAVTRELTEKSKSFGTDADWTGLILDQEMVDSIIE